MRDRNSSVQMGTFSSHSLEKEKAFPFIYTLVNAASNLITSATGQVIPLWSPNGANNAPCATGLSNICPPAIGPGQTVSIPVVLDPDYNFKLLNIKYLAYYLTPGATLSSWQQTQVQASPTYSAIGFIDFTGASYGNDQPFYGMPDGVFVQDPNISGVPSAVLSALFGTVPASIKAGAVYTVSGSTSTVGGATLALTATPSSGSTLKVSNSNPDIGIAYVTPPTFSGNGIAAYYIYSGASSIWQSIPSSQYNSSDAILPASAYNVYGFSDLTSLTDLNDLFTVTQSLNEFGYNPFFIIATASGTVPSGTNVNSLSNGIPITKGNLYIIVTTQTFIRVFPIANGIVPSIGGQVTVLNTNADVALAQNGTVGYYQFNQGSGGVQAWETYENTYQYLPVLTGVGNSTNFLVNNKLVYAGTAQYPITGFIDFTQAAPSGWVPYSGRFFIASATGTIGAGWGFTGSVTAGQVIQDSGSIVTPGIPGNPMVAQIGINGSDLVITTKTNTNAYNNVTIKIVTGGSGGIAIDALGNIVITLNGTSDSVTNIASYPVTGTNPYLFTSPGNNALYWGAQAIIPLSQYVSLVNIFEPGAGNGYFTAGNLSVSGTYSGGIAVTPAANSTIIVLNTDTNFAVTNGNGISGKYQYISGAWTLLQAGTAGIDYSAGTDWIQWPGRPYYEYITVKLWSPSMSNSVLYGGLDASGKGLLPFPIQNLQGDGCGFAAVRTPFLLPRSGVLMVELTNNHPTNPLYVSAIIRGMKVRV
jgi:hypothetical protein